MKTKFTTRDKIHFALLGVVGLLAGTQLWDIATWVL